MNLSQSGRWQARWVFPVCCPPIENGFIEIEDGCITAVGACDGKATDARTVDLGNVALLPGLVNAHAHLEFSDLTAPIEPPQPFTEWIGNLMAYRRGRQMPVRQLVADGWAECLRTGTRTVGEIMTTDDPLLDVLPSDGQFVAFRECIAPVPERIAGQVELAIEHLRRCRAARESGRSIIGGISPHAPYTVLPDLLEQLIGLARSESAPLAMHLAETPAELEYLQHQTGHFRQMLERLGLWRDELHPAGRRPLDFLRRLATLPRSLAVHGNYLADDEVQFLADHPQVAIVYCPRTHRFFGHGPHRWRELLERGASVTVGTDGRSSNPDYSLWGELRLLDQLTAGRLRPTILELGTIRGARALGLEQSTGDMSIGKRADLCCIALPQRDDRDPWRLLFGATSIAEAEPDRVR